MERDTEQRLGQALAQFGRSLRAAKSGHAGLSQIIDRVFKTKTRFSTSAGELGKEGFSASNVGRLLNGDLTLTRRHARDILEVSLAPGAGMEYVELTPELNKQLEEILDDLGFGSQPYSVLPFGPSTSRSGDSNADERGVRLEVLTFEEIIDRQEDLLRDLPTEQRETLVIAAELPVLKQPALVKHISPLVKAGARYWFVLRDSAEVGGRAEAEKAKHDLQDLLAPAVDEASRVNVQILFASDLANASPEDGPDLAEVILGRLPKNAVIFKAQSGTGGGFFPYGHAFIPECAPEARSTVISAGWYYLSDNTAREVSTQFNKYMHLFGNASLSSPNNGFEP